MAFVGVVLDGSHYLEGGVRISGRNRASNRRFKSQLSCVSAERLQTVTTFLGAHVPTYEMMSLTALTRNCPGWVEWEGAGQGTALVYLSFPGPVTVMRMNLTDRMWSVASERGPKLKQEVAQAGSTGKEADIRLPVRVT